MDATFFYRDDLLYQRRQGALYHTFVDQLVLPIGCRQAVLAIAHQIAVEGRRQPNGSFNGSTGLPSMAEFCRSCEACQLYSACRVSRAPLLPLPIITEPFRRRAMAPYRRVTVGRGLLYWWCATMLHTPRKPLHSARSTLSTSPQN